MSALTLVEQASSYDNGAGVSQRGERLEEFDSWETHLGISQRDINSSFSGNNKWCDLGKKYVLMPN